MAQRKQYPLRIDAEVWSAVQKWAADDFRSVNAQVEWILRDALRRAGRLGAPPMRTHPGTGPAGPGVRDDTAETAADSGGADVPLIQ